MSSTALGSLKESESRLRQVFELLPVASETLGKMPGSHRVSVLHGGLIWLKVSERGLPAAADASTPENYYN